MIVLVSGKNVSVTVRDGNLFDGVKKFYAFSNNGYYDPENKFRPCFGGETERKRLYDGYITEYESLIPEAETMFASLRDVYLRKAQELVGRTQPEEKPVEPKPSSNQGGLGKVEEALLTLMDERLKESSDQVIENAKPMIEEYVKKTYGTLPQVHEVKTPKETKKVQGILHEKFDTVMNLVNANIPVFLTGPAGTGKNVICKQVAEALGLEFYFSNAVTQEYKITGFIDANGVYHKTQFFEAFVNGGLFMLDEMDGSIPEVLIMLNAAIANKYFDFPTGRFEAHKDFRIIAAGNTFGTGADMEYTGRYQLDAASLDRFALVEIDYSKTIETALAQNDEALVEYARGLRKVLKNAGIRHLVTYRSIERIKTLDGIMPLDEALKISLIKNLGKDDIRVILGELRLEVDEKNRYFVQTKKLVA